MSRIGRLPIELPPGVKVQLGDELVVIGPKGQLRQRMIEGITVEQQDGSLLVRRASDARRHRARHGLVRALLANMVTGVTRGFEKKLELRGVGYKAESRGKVVVFQLGYSHPVELAVPDGIDIVVEKGTSITVRGIDKQAVGQVAAEIRALRPPDSYKGKGLRYVGERVRLKAGKSVKN